MERYLEKERRKGAIAGPFKGIPFNDRVGVSPISTRAKKDSNERRVITDLSWPPGRSVNSGIGKEQFMGFVAKLTFPTIDKMARRVAELGNTAKLFKIDLSRYFRQLPLDPFDYSLLCFMWNEQIWVDLMAPMGLRSAPYFAQRVSNSLAYIHESLGYFLFNYIEDFLGCELPEKIWESYHQLHFYIYCALQYMSFLSTISSRHRQSVHLLFDTKCKCSTEVRAHLHPATATSLPNLIYCFGVVLLH